MSARCLVLAALLAPTVAIPAAAVAQNRPDEPAPDSLAIAGTRILDEGHPWRATRLLGAAAADRRASPSLRLTAARAAAQWQGWTTVVRLLQGEPWLDETAGGVGRALLGRALLERGQPSEAIRHTAAAVRSADQATRGERLVIHARALDRLGRFDSAAAGYREAAALLPAVGDWLRLRAAGIERDSAAREALYAAVGGEPARSRVPWTEALARDRLGDWRGAADRYAALGADLAAARLRLAGGDAATRTRTRTELSNLLSGALPLSESSEAIQLFDRAFQRRTPTEELRIARRAAAVGLTERAVLGFGAARAMLTDRDRLRYAQALAREGRTAEALPVFDAIKTPALKADAAYQKARLLVRGGERSSSFAALAAIPEKYPGDSVRGATALFLMGDLFADRGVDDSARRLFRAAATRFPSTPFGQRSAFQAALIAYLDGEFAQAAAEFDTIARGTSGEAAGARYWAGRAYAAAGDSATAIIRWKETGARHPDSYYDWLASRRLGTTFRTFGPAPEALPAADAAALDRAAVLSALGLRVEARFELDAFGSGAAGDQRLAVARALSGRDLHARALRFAQRALDGGARFDRPLAELLYPLPFREVLVQGARAAAVDPMLVAGVIRQESLFDPAARSVADARGLMQVLPSVGEQQARRAGLPEWDPVLLYQPDVNLDMGIEHLAEALARLQWPERALAAYNAGAERVSRWQAIRGVTEDPEIFVERIPFTETRDYVRKVLRNFAMYSALYRAPAA